jgi:hypothetical protein
VRSLSRDRARQRRPLRPTRPPPTALASQAGLQGPVLPGILLASLFPAIIGSRFPGAVYASQTLAFRQPAQVEPLLGRSAPRLQAGAAAARADRAPSSAFGSPRAAACRWARPWRRA